MATEKCRYCYRQIDGELAQHYIECRAIGFALGPVKYNEKRADPNVWVCAKCEETDTAQRSKHHPRICNACLRSYQKNWYRQRHRLEDAQGRSGRIGHARPKAG